MIPAFATNLSFTTGITNMKAEKIDGFSLKTYDMILARFFIQASLERVRFFKEIFLLTKTNMELVLGMFFPALSNVVVKFDTRELI